MIHLTRQERLILVFLAAALALGAGVKILGGRKAPAVPAAVKMAWDLRTPKTAAPTAAAPKTPAGKVELNSAGTAELESLPGIGPTLAARIVAYRAGHPPFRAAGDLAAVKGISPRLAADLEPFVTATPPPAP